MTPSLKMTDVIVLGEGPLPCRGMLIGQNPGADEVRMFTEFDLPPRPFIGQAGQEQDEMLSQCGLHRSQLYITNAYKCYTEDNRRPTHQEFEEHKEILLEEIRQCQPYVIGGVGVEASQYLSWLGHQTFRDMASEHGIPRYIEIDGWKTILVPLTHPAAGLHAPSEMGKILWDYQVFGRVLRGEQEVSHAPSFSALTGEVTSIDHLDSIIVNTVSKYIYIDTEGDKSLPWGLTFSVDGVSGWRVGIEQPDTLTRFNELLHHLVIPKLTGTGPLTIVLHNSLHDIPVLLELGVDIRDLPIVDTMILAYLLCVEPQGLKALGWRWVRYWMTEYKEIADPKTEEMAYQYLKKALEVDWDKCTVCGKEGGMGKKHEHKLNPLLGIPPDYQLKENCLVEYLTPKCNIKKKFLPYVNWCEGGKKGSGGLNAKLKKIIHLPTETETEIDDNSIPF